MKHFFLSIKKEIISVIPAIIFFVISFNLIFFTESLMLGPDDKQHFTYLSVTIGALVVGKMMIVIDNFRILNAFPNKPLIYNISWKVFIYCFFIFLFRLLESFILAFFHNDSIDIALQHIQHQMQSSVFWAVLLWLFALFIIYVTASEFIEQVGKDKVVKILFKKNLS